jgi:hypothetical protein
MFARELFKDVSRRGWSAVEQWKKEHTPESVHLEFKLRDPSAPAQRLSQEDHARLAKTVSGFANTSGGLYVLGVDARQQGSNPDAVVEITPFADVRLVADEVGRRARQHVEPTVPGLEVLPIMTADGSDEGIVVLLVPESDGGPHRVDSTGVPGVDGQFYMRTAKDTEPASYAFIAALFGRKPPPVLRLCLERESLAPRFALRLENRGRGFARSILIRLWFERRSHPKRGPFERLPLKKQGLAEGWVRRAMSAEYEDALVLESQVHVILYPDDACFVTTVAFDTRTTDGARVRGRIDCDGAQPVKIDPVIVDWGEDVLRLPGEKEKQQ